MYNQDSMLQIFKLLREHPVELTLLCIHGPEDSEEWRIGYEGPLESGGIGWIDHNLGALTRKVLDWYEDKATEAGDPSD